MKIWLMNKAKNVIVFLPNVVKAIKETPEIEYDYIHSGPMPLGAFWSVRESHATLHRTIPPYAKRTTKHQHVMLGKDPLTPQIMESKYDTWLFVYSSTIHCDYIVYPIPMKDWYSYEDVIVKCNKIIPPFLHVAKNGLETVHVVVNLRLPEENTDRFNYIQVESLALPYILYFKVDSEKLNNISSLLKSGVGVDPDLVRRELLTEDQLNFYFKCGVEL